MGEAWRRLTHGVHAASVLRLSLSGCWRVAAPLRSIAIKQVMSTLDMLRSGQTATISALEGDGADIRRLLEMGLLPGETVELIGRAPLGDPLAVHVHGGRLAVRKADAKRIRVQFNSHNRATQE